MPLSLTHQGLVAKCNQTPGVDKIWVSKRRYSRLIRD